MTGYIKIVKINTDSDLFVLFKDGYNISNLVWVLFLSNEATFDEFFDLHFDCLYYVGSEASLLLLDQFSIRFDVETMHGYLRIENMHVFITLSKDVYIYFCKDIKFCFSVGDKLSLIETSFGCVWSPTSVWITLSFAGGSRYSKRFFIEDQVVEPIDRCWMAQCPLLVPPD